MKLDLAQLTYEQKRDKLAKLEIEHMELTVRMRTIEVQIATISEEI